ncbi:MAG: NAD(P)-dependent oxidoreductase [Acidimicrobiales bacterium]
MNDGQRSEDHGQPARFFVKEPSWPDQPLAGRSIGIVGYGNLGRSAALNLKDCGLSVIVGSRQEPAADRARAEGFEVVAIEQAIATCDVVWMALPDEVIGEHLSPAAHRRPKPGSLICFSSGYPLAYDLVKPPDDVDVVLLAPRMLGVRIRELFEQGRAFYCFASVEQDATGRAAQRLFGLAKAFGAATDRLLEICAHEEAALDLFVEQSVGPYLGAAVLSAFEVGIAAGLSPEALALELYMSGEMAQTWRAFAEMGFFSAVALHGGSAAFGGFIRMADVDAVAMKSAFGRILDDITSGRFAARFQDELAAGSPTRELIDEMIDGTDPMSIAETRLKARTGEWPD